MKTVRIRSFSGPYFPAFWLNTKWYGISLRIQSKCRKVRTRKTPNTDTFHAVFCLKTYMLYGMFLLLYNKKYLNVSRNLLLRHTIFYWNLLRALNVNDFLKNCCLLKFYKIRYFAFRANKTILSHDPLILSTMHYNRFDDHFINNLHIIIRDD